MTNKAVCLALLLSVSVLFAQANLAGKWTGETQGRGGKAPVALELTVNGGTITGTFSLGGTKPLQIQNAKVNGDLFTFSVVTPGDVSAGRGGGVSTDYSLMIKGNEMTGSVTRGGSPGGGIANGALAITLKKQ